MRILFIAPIPPPISGQSIAVEYFYNYLIKFHEVKFINTNKNTLRSGITSFSRIYAIILFLFEIKKELNNVDKIYLTISESFFGNIRDLFIYAILFRRLKDITIHIHGGSLVSIVFKRSKILFKLNKFFLSKLNAVIVLSTSHQNEIFNFLELSNIKIVPNFVIADLYISENEIYAKYKSDEKIKIIFFSNLIKGKGHELLLKAFLNLEERYNNKSILQFAGSFNSLKEKKRFLDSIDRLENVNYMGLLNGNEKKKFLHEAIVFCLPTSLREGQPISILEAYASGCVVLSTPKEGILDIFSDSINGFLISPFDSKPLEDHLRKIISNKILFKEIAINNLHYAQNNFLLKNYLTSLHNILLNT